MGALSRHFQLSIQFWQASSGQAVIVRLLLITQGGPHRCWCPRARSYTPSRRVDVTDIPSNPDEAAVGRHMISAKLPSRPTGAAYCGFRSVRPVPRVVKRFNSSNGVICGNASKWYELARKV